MSIHYLRILDGVKVDLMTRLPSFLIRLSDGTRCYSPAEIEKQGRLSEYGYIAFDSTEPRLGVYDSEWPLTLDDVQMTEGVPSGKHRKRTLTDRQLRRFLFTEGQNLLRQTDWTQTVDYVAHHSVRAGEWDAWRYNVRMTVRALKAGTNDPRTVIWDDPPSAIEDSI